MTWLFVWLLLSVAALVWSAWLHGNLSGWQDGWRDCCRVNGLPDPRNVVSASTFESYQGKDRR